MRVDRGAIPKERFPLQVVASKAGSIPLVHLDLRGRLGLHWVAGQMVCHLVQIAAAWAALDADRWDVHSAVPYPELVHDYHQMASGAALVRQAASRDSYFPRQVSHSKVARPVVVDEISAELSGAAGPQLIVLAWAKFVVLSA